MDKVNDKSFQWTEFQNNFKLLILDRDDLSPIGRMKYLKTYLVGAATEFIQDQGSLDDLQRLLDVANQVLQSLHADGSATQEGLSDHMIVYTEEIKLDDDSIRSLLDPSAKDRLNNFLTGRIQWLRKNDQHVNNSLIMF